ncbi:MAG: hypothetical protein ACLUD2_15590 [Clostridium sp.]
MLSSILKLRIFRVLEGAAGGPAHLPAESEWPAFPVTVTAKTETTITFDANHEMAGKELNFKIELVEVK